jgi:hypothetical protein
MKRLLLIFALLLSGCHAPTPTTNPLDAKEISSLHQRLEIIGGLSGGVSTTLQQPEPNINLALGLNEHIETLSDKPSLETRKAVSDTLATGTPTKIAPLVEKAAKTQETILEDRSRELADLRKRALAGDAAVQELEKYDSGWFSIKHGVSVILKKLAWWLTGFGVVFLLLRAFAASNPVVGAIFNVLERIVGAVIRGVFSFFPRALEAAGAVSKVKDDTLRQVVDNISALRNDATIAELKLELAKAMDKEHKDVIQQTEKELGYK